jgi:hypothetical protein
MKTLARLFAVFEALVGYCAVRLARWYIPRLDNTLTTLPDNTFWKVDHGKETYKWN